MEKSKWERVIEIFGAPDVMTIHPVTYGEFDPVDEMKRRAKMSGVEGRVEEFKNRLIREIGKITCDVTTMNANKFNAYVAGLTPDDRADLCFVLRGEILQLIFAVKDAK